MKQKLFYSLLFMTILTFGQEKYTSQKFQQLLKKADSFYLEQQFDSAYFLSNILYGSPKKKVSDSLWLENLFLLVLLETNTEKAIAYLQEDQKAILEKLLAKTEFLLFQAQKPEGAYLYAKKFHQLTSEQGPLELRIRNTMKLAHLMKNKDSMISYLDKLGSIAYTEKDWGALGMVFFTKANIYFNCSNDEKALQNYIIADSLMEKNHKHMFYLTMTKNGIVNILIESNYDTVPERYERANFYLDRGIKIADSLGFSVPLAILMEKKGNLLLIENDFEQSLKFYRKALIPSKANNNYRRESSIYDGIAKVHLKQANIDSALHYYKKQLITLEPTELKEEKAIAQYRLGDFYNRTSDFHIAKKYLDQARQTMPELPNLRKENIYNLHNSLTITYQGLGDYKSALASSQRAKNLLEEIQNAKNTQTVLNLESKYQTEKKEQEIALLKSKNVLVEQQKKSQRNFLLVGIGLTSLLGVFMFVLYMNRQKTNQKLKELDKLKSNFFTNISHEFRTPLTLISAPIEEALTNPDLSKEKRNHFKMASRNTRRLLSLVNQLLDLSKIDSGNLALQLEKGSPTQLIAAWSEAYVYLAKKRNIDFETNINAEPIESWFDRDALEKIVANLLGNAIKYTPRNGKIILNASTHNHFLLFEVKNTGMGLTKAQLPKIFERFYQTDEQNEGTGVGLALTKELIELHKGTITVSSEVNAWTTFKATLCITKNKFKNTAIKSGEALIGTLPQLDSDLHYSVESGEVPDTENPILLIVEDNADVRLLLADTFKTAYQVMTANNGKEGIAKALEHIPDLIISDVMMPVKDGIELTKIVKEDERTCHIPIILLTAKAGNENQLKGIGVGADDYITKPFNLKILKSKIKSLIALRKKLQSRYSREVILKPKDIAINSIDERFLKKVQNILDENLVEPYFSVEAFSKAVHMSRMQLHRKLKALTGLTTSEFVRSQRLKLAAQILKKSDMSISEVGYSVGFNDPAYFTKCFRENFQCTPSEYAKQTSTSSTAL